MGSKLKALIVDDEEGARKLLRKLLEETRYFGELRVSASTDEAYEILKEYAPDMIFLDISMPDKDGFHLLEELQGMDGRPGIVLVTAYEQYALKAIKHHAFDYLLKPVNRKELKQCVQKFIDVSDRFAAGKVEYNHNLVSDRFKRIKVNTRNGTLFVNPVNILYCKADGNYTYLFTEGRQLLCSMNIGKIYDLLSSENFIRLGRSLIINLEYITLLDRRQSTVTVVNKGESATLKIPRMYLKELENI